MGLVIKGLCAILIIGLAGMFVLKTPDGKPWLSIEDFLPDTSSINDLANSASALLAKNSLNENDNSDSSTPKNNSGIYRWKDVNGQWQYSDTPPTDQQVETMNVSGNLNKDLIEKLEAPKQEVTAESIDSKQPSNSILPASLSPDKVSQLMEDTKNIQQIMDSRQSQLDQKIGQ